ncbi:oxygen-dependent coproporphyrinogen oxidase [Anaeromyxobacter oryzae]|uniref:coproporphyrinogen oxidase n=2 Tax=Anaeromyxobacter oryzae TaxID=2918170 RepID=A0ABM7X4Z7_9BACT|nr:oxygen-dependent coproporphyrinogen oxidase [Anaeromyxobacter oryzae]BDG06880.1 oxygen-dependent coproporphyrinogen-III oxidase [Anaeromyxobacter oryzae]
MPTSAPPELLDRLRLGMAEAVRALQDEICAALERIDGRGRFARDAWDRPGGGGGVSRVLQDGAVFEKAGVNVSDVHGELAPDLARKVQGEGAAFAAVGLSVVVHPVSPMVPTAHANVRFLRRGAAGWFGGGADLTPYYLFEEDCRHFHEALRDACEQHEPGSYARHKRTADAYFLVRHRGEHRGVGGIFYEDLGGDLVRELELSRAVGRAFLDAYLPVVERRKDLPYGDAERRWQEIRRGRYVEFNLVHDRGTVFGLETGGRIESILMSLPPRVRWVYDDHPAPGSREAALLDVLRKPRDWA